MLADTPEEPEPEEEEPEEDELPLYLALMAASVFLPAMPSAVRPIAFWKATTASSVLSPKLPVWLPL